MSIWIPVAPRSVWCNSIGENRISGFEVDETFPREWSKLCLVVIRRLNDCRLFRCQQLILFCRILSESNRLFLEPGFGCHSLFVGTVLGMEWGCSRCFLAAQFPPRVRLRY
jgi:hypothetical protein